jgi:hypothetical protein
MAQFIQESTGQTVTIDDSKAERGVPGFTLVEGSAAPAKEPTVAELKAEIDRRNEGREDDAKLSKDGNKADLQATLAADDSAGS